VFPGPRKTSFAISLAFPISLNGILMLLVCGGLAGIVRFCEYITGEHAVALSSAMVVVFALAAGAYVSRCLIVVAESSSEGYDAAPSLPNPVEVEELFGASLGLIANAFFAFAPFLLVTIIGLDSPWIVYTAVGIGAAYLPMGILGQAVRGDMSGSLPVRVLPAIVAALHRYLPAAVLTAAAGFLVLAGRDGTLEKLPTAMLIGVDTVAGWLLFAAVHRAGVVHREEYAVRAILPVPEPILTIRDSAIPHRPLSDIERALLEREKENSSQ
jgi:hypothetical protein